MNIAVFKIIAFIAILITGISGGFVSLRLAASKRSKRLFSFGNAFAGGIFLGAGLIHMLPDAHDNLSQLSTNYPWAFLICAIGYLIVLLLEKVVAKSHSAVADSLAERPQASIYPYMLILVLSIHSIIAGIALGSESTIGLSIVIFIALISHKWSAAFALGVSLIEANIRKTKIKKIIILFAFATPLGIIMGASLCACLTGNAEGIFEGSFDAIAAGTFLYIAIAHVLAKEFKQQADRWQKFLMATAGLGLMALLAIWT